MQHDQRAAPRPGAASFHERWLAGAATGLERLASYLRATIAIREAADGGCNIPEAKSSAKTGG
jgi:hypothetical protein